ncbi:MAG TPA: CocE/NonD family hydrolase, partial [Acidimicrobiales bacterium]|nr:CocE/NonD family hydrolase [Acidimicrobiales bacterium]
MGGPASDPLPSGAAPSAPQTLYQRFLARAEALAARRVYETGIAMRDGVELAADVYLPAEVLGTSVGAGAAAGAAAAAVARVPAIVEVTPYNKDNAALLADDAELYQRHGYVFVAVDCRGRGKSGGDWVAMVEDAADTHDVIEWAAAQPWCDGNVGITGLSYMGWVQWAAASERPPHLRAMVSTSAAGRWQQEIPYTNGAFQLYFVWWCLGTNGRIQQAHARQAADWEEVLRVLPVQAMAEQVGATGPSWDVLSRHETLDEMWRSIRFDDRYCELDVPCLHVTGWYDIEDLLGAFHHYEHMAAHSPARDTQYLLVGPWSHLKSRYTDRECGGVDFGPDAAWDMDAEHLAFFDHFLKGADNGVEGLERVRVFEPGRNAWRGAPRWPLSDTDRSLFLAPGSLVAAPPAESSETEYRYDPLDPARTVIDVATYPSVDPALDLTANEARDDVVCYTGEVLTGEVTISGWPSLELFASSDGEDTDWHVKVTDVTPEGRSIKVTQGCLRAACRDSLERPAPLEPGRVYRFVVELWPTHHV